jgi:acyl transferase domain-containing protein
MSANTYNNNHTTDELIYFLRKLETKVGGAERTKSIMVNKVVGLGMDQAAVNAFWARADVQSDPRNPRNKPTRGSKARHDDTDDDADVDDEEEKEDEEEPFDRVEAEAEASGHSEDGAAPAEDNNELPNVAPQPTLPQALIDELKLKAITWRLAKTKLMQQGLTTNDFTYFVHPARKAFRDAEARAWPISPEGLERLKSEYPYQGK